MKKIILSAALALIFISCSSSKVLKSTYTQNAPSDKEQLISWIINNAERNNYDGLIHYFTNDDQFLYTLVEINNSSYARDAMRYGLTIYFDKDFRRSFGITYPTGLLHGLSDFPGARKAYLQNPAWENNPENRHLIETVERNLPEFVQLTMRSERRGDLRPSTLPISHLQAQNITLYYEDSGRTPIILMKIPLELRRNQQFALDAVHGQVLQIGFEVKPPSLDEIEREEHSSMGRGGDLYGQERQQQRQMDMQRSLSAALRGGFEYWTSVKISSPVTSETSTE